MLVGWGVPFFILALCGFSVVMPLARFLTKQAWGHWLFPMFRELGHFSKGHLTK
jgi:hypothetical protein